MQRRGFITLLAGTAVWPLAAHAQQPKLPIIGFLNTATPSTTQPWITAFVQRLHELGWIEGGNVTIEVRSAEGRTERFAEIATEFARLKVNVIVTMGAAVPAAKQATSIIPIIFAVSNNPVAEGFVTSLARPGGNVTGLSLQAPELAGKRLALLREVIGGLRSVAIIANVGYAGNLQEGREVQGVAKSQGLEVAMVEILRVEEIAPAFETLKGRVEAVYVCSDPFLNAQRIRINTLALDTRLATIYGFREPVEDGALMSYGASFPDLFRRAADFVDKILRGAKPADIPVEQPTKFDLVIKLKTAKLLGLQFPDKLLALADKVIE